MLGGQPAPQLSKAKCLTIITRRTKPEVTAIILSLKQVILYQYNICIFDSIVYMCSFHDVPSIGGNYFTAPFLSPNSSSFPLHSHTGWIIDVWVLAVPGSRAYCCLVPGPRHRDHRGTLLLRSRPMAGLQIQNRDGSTLNLNTVTRQGWISAFRL